MNKISWYRTSVGAEEVELIREAMLNECISMGRYTQKLEQALAKKLEVPYCVITPSGSVAIFIALRAVGVGPGDEVIVPNRGWVAAAHAVMLTGAKPVLADVRTDIPIIDVEDAKRKVTSRTKAIVPLHLNGRSADMKALMALASSKGLKIVDDACQAIFSRTKSGFIGTQGHVGCFSLGMAKLVATGQGGFVVTKSEEIYKKLKLLRNHGVKDNFTDAWHQWGFNFKFTDIQAAMGLVQLKKTPKRIQHLKAIYKKYDKAFLKLKRIRMIPVDLKSGEIPLYIEALVDDQKAFIEYFTQRGIQVRPATPDLDPTPYFKSSGKFLNSRPFSQNGVYLPGGPEQPLANIDHVVAVLKEFDRNI